MEHRHDDVGVLGLGRIQPVENCGGIHLAVVGVIVGVEEVHAVLGIEGQTHVVEALGEGDEGDLNSVDLPDDVAAGGAGVAGVGTHRVDAGGVEDIDGGGQAAESVHNGIGVGGLENVEADVAEILRQDVRRVEVRRGAGIAGVRRGATEIEFQIAHGEVGAGGVGLDGRERISEIVGHILLLRGVDLGLVDHDIAHGGQSGGLVRVNRRRLYHRRLLNVHLLILCWRFLFSGATANDQKDNQNENQRCDAQGNPLFDFMLALHFQALEPTAFQHFFVALIFFKILAGHSDPSLLNELLFIIQYFAKFLNYFFGVAPIYENVTWGLAKE